ncbi:tyrosine-type recombinase/integrase [Microvirga mediterraneensis]|uniref:Site-specific integrase n=1 Tax=Microvirga mediterraneensis TaxID=2754695 RepID=A0A838BN60_9HYPH|nr:site-specific integrase [Microvirga mediterraneensis]MBA1156888.1 site-specific integrase [Microvirga mediterraneensis]
MSVYRPKDKDGNTSPFYVYDFQYKRRRFHGNTECRTKSEARKVEERERERAKELLRNEAVLAEAPMTLDIACGKFWIDIGQYYNGNARKTFKSSLAWLVKHAGADLLLSEVTNRLVSDLVATRRGEGVKNATVNRTVTEPLRRVLRKAADAWDQKVGKINWDSHLLEEPDERVRELTKDEEARIVAALTEDYQAVFRFALLSGFRLSECVNLKWSDIDWHGRTVSVLGKGNKRAKIPLTKDLRELLFPLQGRHPEAVFAYKVRRPRKGHRAKGEYCPMTYEGTKTAWRRALAKEETGVTDFRFHDNRHTAATRLLRSSGNLKLVQKLLRHEDIATTTKYAHVTDEDLRLAMETAAESQGKSQDRKSKTA